MSPPTYTASPDDRLPVSGGDAYLAYLAREALRILRAEGVECPSRRDALRIAREFADAREADDRAAVLRLAAQHRGQEARQVLLAELRGWIAHRRRKLRASDPSIGGPSWRLTT
jgi:hypothetical protein